MPERSPEKEEKPAFLLHQHRKTVEWTRGTSPAVLLGSSFAFAMGLFAWLGMKWDEKHASEPWGVLTGVFFGFLYGAYEVWKVVRMPGDRSPESPERVEKGSPGPDKG